MVLLNGHDIAELVPSPTAPERPEPKKRKSLKAAIEELRSINR